MKLNLLKSRGMALALIISIFVGILCVSPFATTYAATSIYISPNGDDIKGNGSISAPYKPFTKASSVAVAGDTIYARGGTYSLIDQQSITCAGTPSAYITFMPYQSEVPVFDATGAVSLSKYINFTSTAAYVIFDGFEVRNNSVGRGITFSDCHDIIVRNCKVHDIQGRAIGGQGDNITIENNEVYNCVLENLNGAKGSGGWSAAISSWFRYSPVAGAQSKNWVVRNNSVHNNWGEGIIVLHADGFNVEGNVVYDNWSTELYIDNSRNVTFSKNFAYTNDSLGRYVTGIKMACEDYQYQFPLENITISNNLFLNVNKGINYWYATTNTDATNYYTNIKIYNNVVKDVKATGYASIDFVDVPADKTQPTGCENKNNIVYSSASATSLNIADISGWTIGNNCWPDGVPSQDTSPNSFAADPDFVNPALSAGVLGFQLQSTSPCIDAGTPVSVTIDFWGTSRDSTPCIGIHEYLSQVPTTNVNPVADAYVRDGGYSSINYGTEAGLMVKDTTYTGNNRHTFLKFDLSSLSQTNTAGAVLKVYCNTADTAAAPIKVFSSTVDTWTETGITWSNQPATSTELDSEQVGTAGIWYSFDVTSFVSSELAGDNIVTLCLLDNTVAAKAVTFDSREATNIPVLEIQPQAVTYVNPAADSYVRDGGYSSINYGTESGLMVKNTTYTGNNRCTFFKFDLSSLSQTSTTSAILKVYCNAADTAAAPIKVFSSTVDTWTETGITWSNQPATSTELDSEQVGTAGIWYSFDVTSFVSSELAGDNIVTLCLLDDTVAAKAVTFDSREAANIPVLEIHN